MRVMQAHNMQNLHAGPLQGCLHTNGNFGFSMQFHIAFAYAAA